MTPDEIDADLRAKGFTPVPPNHDGPRIYRDFRFEDTRGFRLESWQL